MAGCARNDGKRDDGLGAQPGGDGGADPKLVCPHCGERGGVHTAEATEKAGLSGGKVAAAVLTYDLSLVFLGLSRKRRVTLARCANCDVPWRIE